MKTIAGDIILHISTKNHNFEKMRKTYGDVIILHMCSQNHNI